MSIGRDTLLNLGGNVIPMVLTLATVPIYLGYIGAERYGVLAVIWAMLGYFGFCDFGFGRAITQRMARLEGDDGPERSKLLWTALLSTLLLGLIASVLLWASADYILTTRIDMSEKSLNEVSGAVIWMLIALPIILPTTVLQGALQARLKFVELNLIQLICNTVSQVLPLAVAAAGEVELSMLVPAALASRALMAILLLHQCARHVPLIGRPVVDRLHLKALLSYGGWVSVMTFLAPFLVTVDRLIIAMLSGAKSVTSYTVPYDLVSRTMVISSSLSSAIFPRLASSSEEQSYELANRTTSILIAVITPIVITGSFVIDPFLNVWLGSEFAKNSSGVGELILVGVWVNSLVIPHQSRLMAIGNPRIVVIVYLIQVPIYLLMLWIFISQFGVLGAAIAWVLRVVIDTGMLLHVNQVLIKTLRMAIPQGCLVFLAAFSAINSLNQPIGKFAICVLLITITLIKDKKLLLQIASKLSKK